MTEVVSGSQGQTVYNLAGKNTYVRPCGPARGGRHRAHGGAIRRRRRRAKRRGKVQARGRGRRRGEAGGRRKRARWIYPGYGARRRYETARMNVPSVTPSDFDLIFRWFRGCYEPAPGLALHEFHVVFVAALEDMTGCTYTPVTSTTCV